MIAFNESDHSYRLVATGERLLSVTQILRAAGLVPDYTGIPPHVLKHAAERGSHVDACLALGDDLDVESVHPEARGYVLAWRRFCERERYVPLEEQMLIYHPDLHYAGTVDSYGTCGTQDLIVERKCTSKIDASYAVQTAGYAMKDLICVDADYRLYANIPRWLVQLKPDGTYTLVDCDAAMAKAGRDDFDAFRAALTIARWKVVSTNGRARGTEA
jgi:hypothetical protein